VLPLAGATVAAAAPGPAPRLVEPARQGGDLVHDRRLQKEVDELGIELCAPAGRQDVLRAPDAVALTVAAAVRDGIEGIGDGDDPGREGNAPPLELARIPRTIPALVMREDALTQLRIEGAERLEDLGATTRMRRDRAPRLGSEARVLVDDVDECLVDLADVVKEGDTLDGALLGVREAGSVGQRQGVGGDAPDVVACLGIIGTDCIEERLEGRGAEALGGTACPALAHDQRAEGETDRERHESIHEREVSKNRTAPGAPGVIHNAPVTRSDRDVARVASDVVQGSRSDSNRSPCSLPSRMGESATVTAKGARRWQLGHPWIYRSDVEARPTSDAGAVAVRDHRGKPLGWALWSPISEISLRLLDRDPQARIDADWWKSRIEEAVARRRPLAGDANAYRLIHGEADGCPSLICDRYDRCLVVQLMSAGLEHYRVEIVRALEEIVRPEGILARNDAAVRSKEGLARETALLAGDVPREIEVAEHGVRYVAAPWTGQKTGAFLDQRENRAFAGRVARGRALDCFSYHGSFALHLARCAEQVTSLDSSAAALERGRINAALNGLTNIDFAEADAFDYLRAREADGSRYDTIVLDPPAFAKSRTALPGAVKGYKDVNLRAMRLLERGGLLFTASCSFHLTKPLFLDMLQAAAADSGRRIALREVRGQPADHPEVLTIPETGYLKAALLEALD
jgi:23S rRNA (cytosine1962-C5)-methyltransferase